MNAILKTAVFSSILAFSFAGVANGADTGAFEVRMTVNGSCDVTVPGTIDFGSVNASAQASAKTATLKVKCTAGENPNVVLASQNNWNMKGTGIGSQGNNDGKLVPYSLFYGSDATTLWNEGNPVSITGTGNDDSLPIYATVNGQATHSGVYTDVVTVSLSF